MHYERIRDQTQQAAEPEVNRATQSKTKSDIQLTTFTAIEPDTFEAGLKRLKYLDPKDWKWISSQAESRRS